MPVKEFVVAYDGQEHRVEHDTDDGIEVLRYQLFSLTLIHPENQAISVDGSIPIESDSDLAHVSSEGNNKIHLEDTTRSAVASTQSTQPSNADISLQEKADEELARLLQAEEDALLFQDQNANEDKEEFRRRLQRHLKMVMMYEDPIRQEAARKSVPIDELEEKALVVLAKEGKLKPTNAEKDHSFLLQLLFWFKKSFSWVNQPACDFCGSETIAIGMDRPTTEEHRFDAANVELYRCKTCMKFTRFPRYNDPIKLLETRRGRCGEWANCFTLYCRALGYRTRLILDFTDHVWTECFSNQFERWIHLDPCEGAYDQPLLYEQGWNKKLSYVIALSRDGVRDVTKRYTRKWHEILLRRLITAESNVQDVTTSLTSEIRRNFSPSELAILESIDVRECDELDRSRYPEPISCPLPGRQSGSEEWRIARAEIGSDNPESSKGYSCPWRTCMDEYVGNVYKSIGLLVSGCLKICGDDVGDVLRGLKNFLLELQAKPFRSRKLIIDSKSNILISHQILQVEAFQNFLESLSLERSIDEAGKEMFYLAGDPVLTSLALPVALDIFEELINEINTAQSLAKSPTVSIFADFERVCCGAVQASGEQLPLGIVTAAFDGLQSTKWEEPEGGKGSVVTYKLKAGSMQELIAYQFTSANDAPERDPKDWLLEGSVDGGITWHVIDNQKSQLFDKRFFRKTFMITSATQLCNAFRIKFSSVRDVNATNRLQLARIDLFAKEK